MKTYTRLILAYAMLPFAVSIASAQEPDVYAPGREIIMGLNKIITPKSGQETFISTLGSVKQVVNVRGADGDKSDPDLRPWRPSH